MKVIIITGASSGIGLATAQYFSRKGWEVAGTSRNPKSEWPLDVTSQASVDRLVSDVLTKFGRIDALFNNAGFAQIGRFDGFRIEDHLAAFETNVFGAMRMTRAVLPNIRKQGSGALVHMGSVVSFLPAPYMGSYAASKHALEGFSKSLDHELRGTGVRSVLLRAGFMHSNIATNTAYSDPGTRDEQTDAVQDSIETALARADDPQVVAQAVLKACMDVRTKAVVDVGKEARTLRRLSNLLPTAIFERAFRKQFGLT